MLAWHFCKQAGTTWSCICNWWENSIGIKAWCQIGRLCWAGLLGGVGTENVSVWYYSVFSVIWCKQGNCAYLLSLQVSRLGEGQDWNWQYLENLRSTGQNQRKMQSFYILVCLVSGMNWGWRMAGYIAALQKRTGGLSWFVSQAQVNMLCILCTQKRRSGWDIKLRSVI